MLNEGIDQARVWARAVPLDELRTNIVSGSSVSSSFGLLGNYNWNSAVAIGKKSGSKKNKSSSKDST